MKPVQTGQTGSNLLITVTKLHQARQNINANGLAHYVRKVAAPLSHINAALVDQAAFAGSNFVLNVLLARWMMPEEYGAFVVAYSWFLLVQNFYDSTLIEPMAIYGSGKYRESFRTYLGYIYYGHLALSVIISLLFAAAAFIQQAIEPNKMLGALVGVAVATPFILMRWLTRQPFYVQSRPIWAALGGVLYFIVVVTALTALELPSAAASSSVCPFLGASVCLNTRGDLLSPFTAFITMASGGLFSGVLMTFLLLKPQLPRTVDRAVVHEYVRDHWDYTKWSSPSRMMLWAVTNINYLVLPLIGGLSASGTLRAVSNLVMPFYMATSAITGVLIPRFVRTFTQHGKADLNRRVRSVVILVLFGSFVYAAGVLVFGQMFIHYAYDGQFDDAVTPPLLLTMAITLPLNFVVFVLHAALRAMNLVKLSFQAEILPTLFSLTIGVVIVINYGVWGAYITSAVAYLINLAIVYTIYRRQIKTSTTPSPEGNRAAV